MTRTLPKGLFKRGNVYAVRYSVPTELIPVVGKKEIIRSLATSDLSEALSKRRDALDEIKANLFEDKTTVRQSKSKSPKAITVSQTANRWLSESDGILASTRKRYQGILEIFENYSDDVEVTKINRELALEFMDYLKSTPSPKTGKLLSHRSLQAYQICLASYWSVLDHWGLVDGDMRNPFSGLLRRVAGQKKQVDPRKKTLRPIIREEAECLLNDISNGHSLKYRYEMYVTVRLLWVTACRLGEIASLSLDNIEDNYDHIIINIAKAKTEAGNRIVMVVGKSDCELLREAVRRARITEPVEPDNKGLLFPRVLRGGYNRTIGHYLGKSLENVRKKQTTSSEWDMHSFRRLGISSLINAKVAREERNLAVGHSNKDDIGMSIYAEHGDLREVIKTTFETLYEELGGSLNTALSSSKFR